MPEAAGGGAPGNTVGAPPATPATSVFRPGLLAGQVAVVTGGATGIGYGTAELLGALGAHVVLASRKVEALESAATRLRAQGSAVSIVTLDVRDSEAVRQVIGRIAEDRGRIDLLVNNAAGNFYAPSASLSANAWRSVIEIDLFGTFFCSQAVAPIMRAGGGGRIVNISMTLHYRGWPQMAHATAAKAGIDALTRTLAVEWAPWQIRINAIAPGPIPTEGVRKAFGRPRGSAAASDAAAAPPSGAPIAHEGGDRAAGSAPKASTPSSAETRAARASGGETSVARTRAGDGVSASAASRASVSATSAAEVFALDRALHDYAQRAIPLGRWGTPLDIANMVAFLASPAGNWITGAILVVDGGEWLQRQPV